MSDHPMMDDDLAQAYARAQALRDGAAGPAASVRANVLAAAQAAARQAQEAQDRPPLTPVAGPVAEVRGGRDDAPNLSSWRVRSGAALGALMIIGFALWRFDAAHHYGGTQLASADSAIEARTLQEPLPPPGEPKDLPLPARNLPPPPAYKPPAIVADVAEPTVVLVPPADLARSRDKDVVVAQADNASAERAATSGYRPPSALAAPSPFAASATAPPMVVALAPPVDERRLAMAKPEARFAAPAAPAAAPTSPAAAAAAAPSSDDRRVVASSDGAVQRVEITGASIDRYAEKRAKPAPAGMASAMGAPPQAPGTSLHAAAGANDVEALRRLLADPATRVDAPDSMGRTALMVAVATRRVAAVRVLLAAGADPDHADASGATPRSVARMGPNAEIAALLGVVR